MLRICCGTKLGSATPLTRGILFVYKTAFANARMGRASAVAVMMFALLAIVTLVQLRVFRRTDR